MNTYQIIAEKLLNATRAVVLTGAGASAESGVPTFRGPGGVWGKFRAEDLATPQAFLKDPETVWQWYHHRRQQLDEIQPNAGHYALAEMAQSGMSLHLVTQNVDRLHMRAGSTDVVELHGNILDARCWQCHRVYGDGQYAKEGVPLCECGGRLRPAVVWFGEMLDPAVIDHAVLLSQTADLFFSVGTSSLVQPAASLVGLAKRNGAFVVEINPDATEASSICDEVLREGSAVALPRIVEALRAF